MDKEKVIQIIVAKDGILVALTSEGRLFYRQDCQWVELESPIE